MICAIFQVPEQKGAGKVREYGQHALIQLVEQWRSTVCRVNASSQYLDAGQGFTIFISHHTPNEEILGLLMIRNVRRRAGIRG